MLNAARRCSSYSGEINNFIACLGTAYIRGLTIGYDAPGSYHAQVGCVKIWGMLMLQECDWVMDFNYPCNSKSWKCNSSMEPHWLIRHITLAVITLIFFLVNSLSHILLLVSSTGTLFLNHWGRVTHISVGKLTTIGSGERSLSGPMLVYC